VNVKVRVRGVITIVPFRALVAVVDEKARF